MIRFQCDSCGKTLKVSESKAGKMAKCPACETLVKIPRPPLVPESPAPTAPGEDDRSDDGFDDSEFYGDEQPFDEQPLRLPPKRKKKKKVKKPSEDKSPESSPYVAPGYTEPSRLTGAEEEPTPPWAWAFFIACIAIMIVTRGGAIWGALGGGIGGMCLKIAKATELPTAARITICSVITAILWAGIIGLVAAVNG